jgi:hypothetical protein
MTSEQLATLPDEVTRGSLIEYITFRLEILGQSINRAQMPVLQTMPTSELAALLHELNRRDDGPDAKRYCIATMYASRERRRADEQRESEAKCPPARMDMYL